MNLDLDDFILFCIFFSLLSMFIDKKTIKKIVDKNIINK